MTVDQQITGYRDSKYVGKMINLRHVIHKNKEYAKMHTSIEQQDKDRNLSAQIGRAHV